MPDRVQRNLRKHGNQGGEVTAARVLGLVSLRLLRVEPLVIVWPTHSSLKLDKRLVQ